MRPLFWFITIIAIGIILAGTARTGEEEMEAPLHTLMEMAGADVVEGEITYWAVLDRPLDNISQLTEHAREVAGLIGIEGKRERELSEKRDYLMALLEGVLPAGVDARVIVQTLNLEKKAQGPPASYLMISLVQQGEARDLNEYTFRLPALLSGRDQGVISFTLMGELGGALKPGQEMELATGLVKQMGGEVVEKVQEDNFISVTAYIPRIASKIDVKRQPVNLNIALRYDSFRKKTVIWAGIPVIQRPY